MYASESVNRYANIHADINNVAFSVVGSIWTFRNIFTCGKSRVSKYATGTNSDANMVVFNALSISSIFIFRMSP